MTHEKYAEKLGNDFGKDIPAIFTDEPQFAHKTRLEHAHDRKVQFLPYTDDFEETYQKAYGETFLNGLPEIFWKEARNRSQKQDISIMTILQSGSLVLMQTRLAPGARHITLR